ncbi:transacetylase [Vibrio breoganii]|uniref:acyltransferase n=1 Tax=Vibrio breoganii TaxID=553239 RepID=UPI000C82BE2D|nr:acyltransferase [Vibrio breoganii]PML38972.1 transacetylase [Vibrio breoganii]
MPKTLKGYIANKVRLTRFRLKGNRVYNNVILRNVGSGINVTIEPYCRIVGAPLIDFGDNVYINSGCSLTGDIKIGNDVMIGPKCILWSRDHGTSLGEPMIKQQHIEGRIVIGEDVWIGANVTILKNVNIAKGTVVAAGSVVTKDTLPNSIVAGNPAKLLKYRS